jgi:hypothetical protein
LAGGVFRSIGLAVTLALGLYGPGAQAQPAASASAPAQTSPYANVVCVTAEGQGPTTASPGSPCYVQTSKGRVRGIAQARGHHHAGGVSWGRGTSGYGGESGPRGVRPVDIDTHPSARPVRRPIGTRLFTAGDAKIPQGYGAIAIVVFPRAPLDDADRDRAMRICRAYVGVLPDSAAVRAIDPNQPQMVTVWPRRDLSSYASVPSPSDEAALVALCGKAVQNYYYEAAQTWLSHVPSRAKIGSDRRGPFLIAWAPPSDLGDPRNPILVFDLSDFDEQDAIGDAFTLWKERIEADPSLWEGGWDLTRWRLFTRAGLDHYGPKIMAAIELVPFMKSPK